MQYKITANITNYTGAATEFTEEQLRLLTDGDTVSSGIALSSGDEIELLCELYNRYDLNACRYYHSGDGTVSFEVAESDGVWYSVSSSSVGSYVQADLSTYDPRWLRITHDSISSSTLYEVEIYSENNNILMGPSGQYSSYGMDAVGSTTQAVQVFNNTSSVRDIYLFIEDDQSIEGDDFLLVGLTSSGTFYSKYEQSINFPSSFSWDSGQHNGTITTVSGHLTLSGSTPSGTYYSPVFDVSAYDNYRFFWQQDNNTDGFVDYVSSVDSEDCFGVRRYYIPPSGVWSNGSLAEESDSFWSLSTGLLEFEATPNNTILEFRDYPYIQFAVTFSGTEKPHIYRAGVEKPITLSGIQPNSYQEVYLKLSSPTTPDSQLGLLCWYKE